MVSKPGRGSKGPMFDSQSSQLAEMPMLCCSAKYWLDTLFSFERWTAAEQQVFLWNLPTTDGLFYSATNGLGITTCSHAVWFLSHRPAFSCFLVLDLDHLLKPLDIPSSQSQSPGFSSMLLLLLGCIHEPNFLKKGVIESVKETVPNRWNIHFLGDKINKIMLGHTWITITISHRITA